MYKQITIINLNEHKESSVKAYKNFNYAKNVMNTPITAAEFYESCKDYPIIFVQEQDERWGASVMMGYKENENLFVDENGNWEKGRYIPAAIRRYPFIFVAQNDQVMLGIDTDSLSSNEEDAERKLFSDDKPSEFSNGVLNFMNQFQSDALATANFIKQLNDWELLEERTMNVTTPKGENFSINGFYTINEEKLHHLSKKKKQDICDANAYPLITAHLLSLSNVQRLAIK